MNSMRTSRPGYILILAISIIGLMAALIGRVVHQVLVYNKLQHSLLEREQARLYALSGIDIARSQLVHDSKELVIPFSTLNHWQQFELQDSKRGGAGACEIYVVAEQGKINLNALYDFTKKQFITDQTLDGLKVIQKVSGVLPQSGQIIADALGKFFKERGRPLEDISQLLADKRFKAVVDAWWPVPGKTVSFMDLFTIESSGALIQPLLVTPSLGKVLGLKESSAVDKKLFDTLQEQLKKLKGAVQWKEKWDTLVAPIYGKQYATLATEIRNLFAQEFETLSFSVLSYGKFGSALVKIYAILEQEKAAGNDTIVKYRVRRLYWL